MKIIKIISILAIVITVSCSNNKEQKKVSENISKNLISKDGLLLMQQKCYACHSITSKSHDEIIAPPMAAVKRRYKMSYISEDEFVAALTEWVLDPKPENVLMRGAVQNFNIMPKQPFDKNEIIEIAKYMYNNTLETPEWFETHFNEEHPNGMGNGNGKRKYNN